MKRLLIITAFFISPILFANLNNAPPSYAYSDGKAVFVDFKTAHYKLTYDYAAESAYFEADIEIETQQTGYPLFDLVTIPSQVKLNGNLVTQQNIIDPHRESRMRVIDKKVNQGTHRLEITGTISANLNMNSDRVFNAFWFGDLGDRGFLEQYLPANYEFDQFKVTFEISLKNYPKEHEIFTNGELVKTGHNQFIITFPAHYTASSIYYHLGPVNYYRKLVSNFESSTGETIPVLIYTAGKNQDLQKFKVETHKVLNELEKDYGPWPHKQVLIYAAGRGGMEYCGATRTEFRALGHELFHSYFARGVIPVNGNAGWIDEALASWRDKGYQSHRSPNFSDSNMAGHSIYRRATDRNAYTKGASFMAHLKLLLAPHGGLKKFLRAFLADRLTKPTNTLQFQTALEKYAGQSFAPKFDRFIYGRKENKTQELGPVVENPFHPKLTTLELEQLMY